MGRFLTRDSWQGDYTKPISLNKWAYADANPILYVDRSGLSATVDCSPILLDDVRALCSAGNGDDNDPSVLQARYQFFQKVADMSKFMGLYDAGFWWAGDMLDHFLSNSQSKKEVNLPNNSSFVKDKGILRATTIKAPSESKVSDDEPGEIEPLAHEFLKTIRPMLGCEFYKNLGNIPIKGSDNYKPKGTYPRATDDFVSLGWWGAFGHVAIDADYTSTQVVNMADTYYITTTINYKIEDRYEWYPGQKGTPLPLGGYDPKLPYKFGLVTIPHDWEGSLIDHKLAASYPFTVTWSERTIFIVPHDFYEFRLSNGTGPFYLFR